MKTLGEKRMVELIDNLVRAVHVGQETMAARLALEGFLKDSNAVIDCARWLVREQAKAGNFRGEEFEIKFRDLRDAVEKLFHK